MMRSSFDPTTNTFAFTTGNLNSGRYYSGVTKLANGKVLFVGGNGSLNTLETYDPTTGLFNLSTATLAVGSARNTALLLSTGTVLISGGLDVSGVSIAVNQVYDPTTDSMLAAESMGTARHGHQMVRMNDGRVFMSGGYNSTTGYLNSSEIFQPQ